MTEKKRGYFITFEGVEGSGKSTVARAVLERFLQAGLECVITREPGGNEISEKIREMLLDPGNTSISPRTELLLYVASRAQLVGEVIGPALEKGTSVLCDRFMDASVAYQGWARELGEDVVAGLNSFAVAGAVPDRTYLLDLEVGDGFERGPDRREAEGSRNRDRLELEKRDFHERVREGYLRIASREPGRVVIIDASRSLEEVIEAVLGNLRALSGLKDL
ncbi:MAG: dTMP kinase [Candidatus Krumholzibacteria bacterium]|nr:dTMP kinase [Candidatus Krumholzibacteria bacterium]